MTPGEVRIGDRIRFYRQAQRKTQAVVSGLAGVTEDYLSQIERGLKTPTIALMYRIAEALEVRVSELLGEGSIERSNSVHPVGSAVSSALLSYGATEASAPQAVGELRERVDNAWAVWQGSTRRYTEASRVIPDLIADIESARRQALASGETAHRREVHRVAADMYFLLRTFTRRIGRGDLSMLVADRALAAADSADDPIRIAAARWNLGHVLLARGETAGAEQVAAEAAATLRREFKSENLDALAMGGALTLVEVVAAVRSGDGWKARDLLREKAWPAARAVGEGNVMWTVFGPINVGLHAVSVEMETGEAAQGLRLADDIDTSKCPSVERRTTFALEVARCYEQRRDDPGVLLHLQAAESTGPEDLRYNALSRDLVHGLLKRARPTYAGQVRALAERIGLLD